jgi:hypothetical protein
VAPNPTISARQATLTIAGRVHTINQAGLVCTISVSPGSQTFTAAAANGAGVAHRARISCGA